MIQYIKSSDDFKAEFIIDPDNFDTVKSSLVNIFLKIQEELMNNYDTFLDENFPENSSDDEAKENKKQDDQKIPKKKDIEDEKKSNTEERKNTNESHPFAAVNKMISIKRDVRWKFTNITEKFVESIMINGDEYGLEEKPFQLDDISLSGTTATVVFQIGKRIILAYVGDSLWWIGCREKNKRSINLVTPERDHTSK